MLNSSLYRRPFGLSNTHYSVLHTNLSINFLVKSATSLGLPSSPPSTSAAPTPSASLRCASARVPFLVVQTDWERTASAASTWCFVLLVINNRGWVRIYTSAQGHERPILHPYLQFALLLPGAENARFPATTIDADSGTLSPHASFSGDALMVHTPTQLPIDCLTKLDIAQENPIGMPGTIASAPALLCRRLLHRNILLRLKTKLPGAMFRLPMTKLLQHTNLSSLLLTLRQQCLQALHLKPSTTWTPTHACN